MNKLINWIKNLFEKNLNDRMLNTYKLEANSDRNDGWTKAHYKNLYKQRRKILLKNKSI